MIEHRLRIGGRLTGIVVRPDDRWPGMWRIHDGDRASDMVNLARAKDAAITWFTSKRSGGLSKTEVVHWDNRDTGTEDGSSAF